MSFMVPDPYGVYGSSTITTSNTSSWLPTYTQPIQMQTAYQLTPVAVPPAEDELAWLSKRVVEITDLFPAA